MFQLFRCTRRSAGSPSPSRRVLGATALAAGGMLLVPAAAVADAAPLPLPLVQHERPAPNHYLGMPCDQARNQAEADGYESVRVVEQGQMMTQEYMPERLTLHCDAEGLIEKAAMG